MSPWGEKRWEYSRTFESVFERGSRDLFFIFWWFFYGDIFEIHGDMGSKVCPPTEMQGVERKRRAKSTGTFLRRVGDKRRAARRVRKNGYSKIKG